MNKASSEWCEFTYYESWLTRVKKQVREVGVIISGNLIQRISYFLIFIK